MEELVNLVLVEGLVPIAIRLLEERSAHVFTCGIVVEELSRPLGGMHQLLSKSTGAVYVKIGAVTCIPAACGDAIVQYRTCMAVTAVVVRTNGLAARHLPAVRGGCVL